METGLCENKFDINAFPEIQIQYYGSIRAAAKKSEEKVEFAADTTVYRLLQQIARLYENDFRGELFEDNAKNLRDDLTVTLNGTIVEHKSALEISLKPGDVLALFPIFPGGG